MSKLKIVVCLKTNNITSIGDSYNISHVYKIQEMVKKYVTIDHEFCCLTNEVGLNCKTIPLEYDNYGWWNKLELYKIPGPVFYLDLDTIILDNIDDILTNLKGRQLSLYFYPRNLRAYNRELLQPDRFNNKRWIHEMVSSMMYWSGDMSFLWRHVQELSLFKVLKSYDRKGVCALRGDQELMSWILEEFNYKNIITPLAKKMSPGKKPDPTYDEFPIASFKEGILKPLKADRNINPTELLSQFKIVWFHDNPRPWAQDIIPY